MPSTSKTFQTTNKTQMAQPVASFRTTTSSAPAKTDTVMTKQVNAVHAQHIKILHVRHHWDIVHMSTSRQFRFANQVNR